MEVAVLMKLDDDAVDEFVERQRRLQARRGSDRQQEAVTMGLNDSMASLPFAVFRAALKNECRGERRRVKGHKVG